MTDWRRSLGALACAATILVAIHVPAGSASIRQASCAPGATRAIEGYQLPTSPQSYGGWIERNAAQSTPWWPARIVPPDGAPNVLLIMTDDTGFGTPSTFGAESTPNLDRIVHEGLRFAESLSPAGGNREAPGRDAGASNKSSE